MRAGDRLTLKVEKPAAGGRMIARFDGAVVLVAGAIPGEVVEAHLEKVQRGTAWAQTLRVLERSPDRVDAGDWACGGNVLAHVAYSRQLTLKREIIHDAFRRIGRVTLPAETEVAASPTDGYRMRARLHMTNARMGFYREGTHQWCDPAATRQLLSASLDVLREVEATLGTEVLRGIADVELSENCSGEQRALHLRLHAEANPASLQPLSRVAGLRGASCGVPRLSQPVAVFGHPEVTDTLAIMEAGSTAAEVTLTRQAHAFFQGNRYLLERLVADVLGQVPAGRLLDLYAGVGLFSVSAAARGNNDVIAIEGDRTSAGDLKRNAERVRASIEVRHQAVEAYLGGQGASHVDVLIVDPPRTGMTKDALRGALSLRPRRVVYVSCDVATLARDARLIIDAGYTLGQVRAFDLFPNTAHVETLAVFDN